MRLNKYDWEEQNESLFFLNGADVLDGLDTEYLTHEIVSNIETALCYHYDDGEYADDDAVVLELIFRDSQESIGNHIRLLCYEPMDAIKILGDLHRFEPFYVGNIAMDFHRWSKESYMPDGDIKDEFKEFAVRIKHKEKWHPANPELPDVWSYRNGMACDGDG